MRNRKAINLIARNGKAMWDVGGGTGIRGAAKAVILAEYGTQVWRDVRNYAKAHPAIVEFINQDPHLACSISENSNKERWLKDDGNPYIRLGYVHKTTTNVDITYRIHTTGSWGSLFGARKSNFQNNAYILRFYSSTSYMCYNRTKKEAYNSVETKLDTTYRAVMVGSTANFYENRETLVNTISNEGTNDAGVNEWLLFANNTSSSAGTISVENAGAHSISEFIISEGDDIILHLIPHLTADGQCGMLDLVTYTFHPNANTSGAFTIQVTDKAV